MIHQLFKNKLVKETIWSFAAKGTALILFLLFNVFLARTLGQEGYGTWSFLFSILTISFTIAHFGLNTGTKKFVAQYQSKQNISPIVRKSLILRMIISTLFVLVYAALIIPFATIIQRKDLILYLFSLLPIVFLMNFVEYCKHIFRGLHRLKYTFLINLIEYGGKLFSVSILFWFSIEISNVIVAFIIATFFTTLFSMFYLWQYLKAQISLPSSSITYKDIIQYSLPLIMGIIALMIMTEIDIFMLGLIAGDAQVGLYAPAKQIANKLPQIALAISMGSMPIFAQLNNENKKRLQKIFIQILRINTFIFGLLISITLLLSWWFVPLLFGQEFNQSVPILNILTGYIIFNSYASILSSFLIYTGKAKTRAYASGLLVGLNIILNLIFIPVYGGVGAAWATSISHVPFLVILGWEVKKTFDEA